MPQPEPIEQSAAKQKKPYFITTVAVVVALVIGFIVGTRDQQLANIFPFLKQSSGEIELSSLRQVYAELQNNYDGKLELQKLIDGANRGMAEAAGDQYTTFLTAKEAEQFSAELEGTFSGVGAEIGRRDDRLTIISTLDNSPARRAGLRAGDALVKINDEAAADLSVDQAVSKIRGQEGTTVKISVFRESEKELKDFVITRETITDPSVKSEIIDGVGVIRIARFGDQETVKLALSIARDFKEQGVKGVVVDVRGNGGGYVDTAQAIASLWLDDKVVVKEKGVHVEDKTVMSNNNAILKGIPTVVLIDGGSASASEILAGALKDNNVATLIGTKSFGKGSVQRIIEMPQGGKLKVTIAKWFTPSGRNIDKEGITPDTEVTMSDEDFNKGRDPQRDRALEQLKQ